MRKKKGSERVGLKKKKLCSNYSKKASLETVNLDLLLVDATFLNEKSRNFGTLIALELNNGSQLLILHKGSVASKVLLENLEHALLVKVLGQSLNGGQGLASVALLDTNIYRGRG